MPGQLVLEIGDLLILFADLNVPFGKLPLQLGVFPMYFGMLLAEIVVGLPKPVVLNKQVAEQAEDILAGPKEQPSD